jgi:hypothetical protein
MAQVTARTGFLLQGDTEAERVADTGASWKCLISTAYTPLHFSHGEMRGYFVAGPGEKVDGARVPWGWEQPDYDDSGWDAPDVLTPGSPRLSSDAPNPWMLVPRSIPLMEETAERLDQVREAGAGTPAAFPREPSPITVPPHTKARLLLDNGHLTTAYPELTVSGGTGGAIKLAYAEALFEEWTANTVKRNRDAVEGKEFHGYHDIFLPDGRQTRLFRPLWWRTYRYVLLEVETHGEPLTIEDLCGTYTGYPFERKARLQVDDPDVEAILDVGWRTARLCAHETYMDCPYYEQLQYVGDTRIQGLISLYMSGDPRLLRSAICQIDQSRTAEGATMSRAPTRLQQYIPSFSLFWIGMVHDYWMYVDETDFIGEMLPGVRSVLSFFQRYQKKDGSRVRLPWWRIIDATPGWEGGSPPQEADGLSAPYDLLLLQGYQWAAEMEAELGSKGLSREYAAEARRLRATIRRLYWDADRRLYADTPAHAIFSQHTNSLAVLAGLERGRAARGLMERTLSDGSLVPCALFFKYYLHAAATKAGLGDGYLDLLAPWRTMLANGLTTWPEFPDYPGRSSRSDCHAWSAHPSFELLRTVLGVDTAAPGFRRIDIRPNLGQLTEASGEVPHPSGRITVHLRRAGAELEADIELPKNTQGTLYWRGKEAPLLPGPTQLRL